MSTSPDPMHILAAILYKVDGREGSVVVGDMTLEWVQKNVAIDLARDGKAYRLSWYGPSVKFEGT